MIQHSIYYDPELCWGCQTCEIACKQENRTPDGVKLIHINEERPMMHKGKMQLIFTSQRCRHCEEPECMEACPSDVITKREDGIVVLDGEICDGCKKCNEACPYDSIDFDEFNGVSNKCNMCHHRIDMGLIPACADNVCLAHCIHFGDKKDIDAKFPDQYTIGT